MNKPIENLGGLRDFRYGLRREGEYRKRRIMRTKVSCTVTLNLWRGTTENGLTASGESNKSLDSVDTGCRSDDHTSYRNLAIQRVLGRNRAHRSVRPNRAR